MNARTAAAIDRHIMNPPELEEEEREPGEDCARPGPRGCGSCPGCSGYGDMKFEQKRDKQIEREG